MHWLFEPRGRYTNKYHPFKKQAASSTYISSTSTSLNNSPTHSVFTNNITHIIYENTS